MYNNKAVNSWFVGEEIDLESLSNKVKEANAKIWNESESNFVVKVTSSGYCAGNEANISINGKRVQIEMNFHNQLRGLHMVLLDPKSYKVVYAKAYDTYIDGDQFDDFYNTTLSWNNSFGDHKHIVIAAC